MGMKKFANKIWIMTKRSIIKDCQLYDIYNANKFFMKNYKWISLLATLWYESIRNSQDLFKKNF